MQELEKAVGRICRINDRGARTFQGRGMAYNKEKGSEVIKRYEQKSGSVSNWYIKSEYHMMVVDLIKRRKMGHFCYERLLPMVQKGAIVSVRF